MSAAKSTKWPLLESIFEVSPHRFDFVRQGFEYLFAGNAECHSIVTTVLDCLCRCPIDLRAYLAQNIVVIGVEKIIRKRVLHL